VAFSVLLLWFFLSGQLLIFMLMTGVYVFNIFTFVWFYTLDKRILNKSVFKPKLTVFDFLILYAPHKKRKDGIFNSK
jgi:hypothetical protein